MKRDIVIIGGGEHTNVIVSSILLMKNKWNLLGVTDNERPNYDISWLGTDETFINKAESYLNAYLIIGVGNKKIREKLIYKYREFCKQFITVIHPSVVIARSAKIDSGVFFSANAVIQSETKICKHAIINTGAIVEHDCTIGENTHIAPGVVMGGGCNIGNNCLIGIGATIKDHITIGDNVTVGAGAVVIKDIEDNQTVVGVPAKPIKALMSTDYTD